LKPDPSFRRGKKRARALRREDEMSKRELKKRGPAPFLLRREKEKKMAATPGGAGQKKGGEAQT